MHIPSLRSLDALGGPLRPVPAHQWSRQRSGVRTRLARLIATLDAHRWNRRAAAELMALDDHMLADIGLSRADLPLTRRSWWLADPWSPAGYGLR